VTTKFGDEPGDSLAATGALVAVEGLSTPEPSTDVGVAEALDGVLAGEGGAERGQVRRVEGIKAA